VKKIGLLYPYAEMGRMERDESIKLFLAGPDNIGNKVYLDFLFDILTNCDLVSAHDVLASPQLIKDTYRILILPFSNMISPYYTDSLSKVIEAYELKIILLSVGIQATLSENLDNMVVSPDALTLLRAATRSGGVVGVRGAKTANVLARYGIKTNIIGCPSLLGVKSIRAPSTDRICANATLSGHHKKETADLIEFAVRFCDGYALQDETRIIQDVFSVNIDDINFFDRNSPFAKDQLNKCFDYGYYNNGYFSWGEVRDFFKRKSFFYLNVNDWINELKRFDLSVGMRFHGNIAALVAGTPAIFSPCDMRTLELIEYHNLPYLYGINANTHVPDLIEHANYDRFFQKMPSIISNFIEFAEICGFGDNLILEKITK
jgi:hypothetical protein